MKDIRIDGRMQRVFVLKETDSRVVYIPVKSLHRVDYEFLTNAEKGVSRGTDLLDILSEAKLSNGRNALVCYDKLIQVMVKNGKEGSRLRKPDEPQEEAPVLTQVLTEVVRQPAPVAPVEQEATPVQERRKPGPKPKQRPAE